ncbi:MAG TPA: phosphate acyltransferase [Bacteroidales bacterium]|nr:phosphate acyltransferase [Bacteroidales bacterium]HOH22072.1 phosphate acyltransferase [Bacteroidales bacterium]HPZ04197.1 phosphate acyltransferase [Bacteroidales bacterium]HQB75849.1 phosphate acyltransferase [Bacteroidales bacterium]
MNITKLDQVVELVKSKPKKRLVVAYANDEHTIEAAYNAVNMGIVSATLVGEETTIRNVCKNLNIDPSLFTIIHEPVDTKAALTCCDIINEGKGDILMKGALPTDKYMRAILNKERGLCPPNAIITHITVFENPAYHKLIIAGDCAIILNPDLKQKQFILKSIIDTAHAIGIEKPKVAIIAATEQMSPAMQACVDGAILSKMVERGQIKGALVDGPISLDVALDEEAAKIKKMTGEVAGDADGLLFPNIESGNVFYKASTKFNKAECGAFLAGAKVPCVLSSRGDTALTKLYSIAISAAFN